LNIIDVMETMSETPYLSIVATARNDNHGGNMLRRMQIFINGLLHQCQQYQLPAELIIVEWNPPVDKPPLASVLSWPIENNPCKVRIIEVPPEINRRFKHSEGLPLFQMIAKNVGIRRAKGEFILATNIDLLFSDELFSFLASRQLQPGVMYRIDRYDVRSDVPLEASLEEQLAYCQENIIRVNRRDGTHEMKVKKDNIIPVNPENEITEVKENEVEPVKPPDVVNYQWLDKIPDFVIPLLSLARKIYRSLLPVSLRDAILRQLPPKIKDWAIAQGLLNVNPNSLTRAHEALKIPDYFISLLSLPRKIYRRLLPFFRKNAILRQIPSAIKDKAIALEPLNVQQNALSSESLNSEPAPPRLHTNGCGDFTLMANSDWFALRGYPEFEIFSFHLDSLIVYMAHHYGIKEQVLEEPMRCYHIEHTSGWTPEVDRNQTLNKRLKSRGIAQQERQERNAIISDLVTQRRKDSEGLSTRYLYRSRSIIVSRSAP